MMRAIKVAIETAVFAATGKSWGPFKSKVEAHTCASCSWRCAKGYSHCYRHHKLTQATDTCFEWRASK